MTRIETIGDAKIINADVLDGLRSLPDESVQCCVTSPPYWGLRDYGVEGMIGLEPTFQEYLAKMVEVCREIRRVLRSDGVMFLNMGDAYFGSWGNYSPTGAGTGQREKQTERFDRKAYKDTTLRPPTSIPQANFKPKDLLMMPARLAIALQEDGWYLRSEIIWSKPNPMPESVTDRPTSAHEKIYLLTKSARYFYDADAVREKGGDGSDRWGGKKMNLDTPKAFGGDSVVGNPQNREGRAFEYSGTRNLRNVWKIATQPYSAAHFATFPEALPRKCIMAGTSERGCCSECGSPWERVVEHSYEDTTRTPAPNKGHLGAFGERAANMTRDGFIPNRDKQSKTIGFQPTCDCDAPTVPCTVLDPFNGACTTGLVALKLGRKYIGIELNPDYVDLSLKRIDKEARQEKLFTGSTGK